MTAAAAPKPADLTIPALVASAMKLIMADPLFKVGETEIRGNTYRVFENIPANLSQFFAETTAAQGDKPFLSYGDDRLSFAGLHDQALRFANGLADRYGVKKGDHVAIAMRNYPEWCVAYVGLVSIGAVVVPLNAWWKGEELKYGLKDSGAKIVITDGRRHDYIKPFKDELGLTLVLARDEGEDADARFEELVAAGAATAPATEIGPDDHFCIVYTSGSTGGPKGVVLTHRGALSAIYSWFFVVNVIEDVRGASLAGDNPGVLLAVPLFHVTGSHSIFMLSFLLGRRVAMMHRWDAEEAAKIINAEGLTNFVGVPSQSFELMQAAGNDGLETLVDVGSGGAKRPPDQVEKLSKAFSQALPSSGYGLSETNALGCIISQNLYQERPGSTGRPVPPLTDIRIVKDGADQSRGEVGEIWIRSAANFEGYWNLPDDTAAAITPDGWFQTGDLGYMDEDDFLYIVDRIKDIIIRGGENISCLEVEAAAYEFEIVAEAAVFAVPDETLGERVGLVVYPKEGAVLEASDLYEFMSEKLAGFKTPERIWISPSSLPRLGTEKFDKLTIKKIALQHPPSLSM